MKYLILFFFVSTAWATNYHHRPIVNSTNVIKMQADDECIGLSASQLHFDWATTSLQGGAGVGFKGDCQAGTFGLGKRTGDMLINGTVSTDGEDAAYGAGINWRF